MKTTAQKLQKGFTLIELLVVIGILAILLSITLVAINPAKQFASAHDAKRQADVTQILSAINQYMVDNQGLAPATITTTVQSIANTGANLCAILSPKYIAQLPSDPTIGAPASQVPPASCGTYNTGYTVSLATGSAARITVSATAETAGTVISVSR